MNGAFVRSLRSREIDVLTALDADMIQRPDEDHLRFATGQDRVLYSFNLADFYRIHERWLLESHGHAGLILAQQQRYAIGDQMRRLIRIAGSRSAESMRDRLEFLSHWGT